MDIILEAKRLFEDCKLIPKNSISLKPEVRKMCERNACGYYNRNWTCPPALPELEAIKVEFDKYEHFALVYQIYPVINNLDLKGMMEALSDFQERLLTFKKSLKDQREVLVLGAGGCSLCKKCTYPEKACVRPQDAIVSLEAYGMDVVKLMLDNNLKYNNGPKTVTFIGGLMY